MFYIMVYSSLTQQYIFLILLVFYIYYVFVKKMIFFFTLFKGKKKKSFFLQKHSKIQVRFEKKSKKIKNSFFEKNIEKFRVFFRVFFFSLILNYIGLINGGRPCGIFSLFFCWPSRARRSNFRFGSIAVRQVDTAVKL